MKPVGFIPNILLYVCIPKSVIMKTKTLFLVVLILISLLSQAQNETTWWYFGTNAGISFTGSGGTPVAQTNGKLSSGDGVASISNAKGDLLFYTDGATVYNKQHAVMTNGTGLKGDINSTQSSIIVQQPVRGNRYYIFTTDSEWGNDGFQYSIVDTTLNSGNGQIVSKNANLLSKCAEKVSAVLHANKVDVWVVTHSANDNKFYAYKLNSSGIVSPVVSSVGPTWVSTGSNARGYAKGYLKFSPDGTKLVAAIAGQQDGSSRYLNNAGRIEIYDFDNVTGEVSNPQIIDKSNIKSGVGTISSVYGVEFSPNSRLLYTSFYMPSYIISGSDGNDGLWQFDLAAGNANAIGSSCEKVVSSFSTNSGGGMQLGPDGKIYLARGRVAGGAGYISCIENPNCKGSNCSFVDNAISLSGKTGNWGLPNFITTFLSKPQFIWGINPSSLCQNEYTRFFVPDSAGFDSAVWNFGDPNSGKPNVGRGFSPYHVFSNTGSFNVFLALYRKTSNTTCVADTGRKKVTIFSYPKPNIGRDTAVCQGQEINLTVYISNATYLWKDNSIVPAYAANTKGWHWVDAKVGGCTKRDSMYLDIIPNPKFSLGNDTTYCLGDSVKLTASDGQKYVWNNGKTTASIFTKDTGFVLVTATKGNCKSTDSIRLKNAFVNANFIIDNPGQCFKNNVFNFRETSKYNKDGRYKSTYHFYDASTVMDSLANRTFPNAGTYTIKMIAQSKLGCIDSISKTVNVLMQTKPDFYINNDSQCLKENSFDFINTTQDTGKINYEWDLGDKTLAYTKDVKGKKYSKDTFYMVQLIGVTSNNCRDTILKKIAVKRNPEANFKWKNVCNTKPTDFEYSGSKPYQSLFWDFNNEGTASIEKPSKVFNDTGVKKIKLIVTATNSCTDTSVKFIKINIQPIANFTVDKVCEGDTTFFINKSVNADTYKWNFWDANSSTLESPKHLFVLNGLPNNMNVTLVTYNKNGCRDSIFKSAYINANPISAFDYSYSKDTLIVIAKQAGNTQYRWLWGNGDSATGYSKKYKYKDSANGKKVCLRVTNAAGCFSETCKVLATTRISYNQLQGSFKIYPNPNSGNFKIEIENPEKDISIEVYNTIGEMVERIEKVEKISNINLNVDVGIYLVKVRNGEMKYNQKVSIVK